MNSPAGAGHELGPIDRRAVALSFLAAVVAGFVVWWLVHGEGPQPPGMGPTAATADEIRALAVERGIPVYWLGERPGTKIELAESDEGHITVRYLPPGVEIGALTTGFLSVGTYPVSGDAYAVTEEATEVEGAIVERGPGGALVVTNAQRPTSVYVARRGSSVQVEVYDPDPERAMRIARSGQLRPIR